MNASAFFFVLPSPPDGQKSCALKGIEASRVRTSEHCRTVQHRSERDASTKRGAAKAWYENETANKVCVDCGKRGKCELDCIRRDATRFLRQPSPSRRRLVLVWTSQPAFAPPNRELRR